eukprot:g568.t1
MMILLGGGSAYDPSTWRGSFERMKVPTRSWEECQAAMRDLPPAVAEHVAVWIAEFCGEVLPPVFRMNCHGMVYQVPVLVPWMPMEATESSSQSPSLEEEVEPCSSEAASSGAPAVHGPGRAPAVNGFAEAKGCKNVVSLLQEYVQTSKSHSAARSGGALGGRKIPCLGLLSHLLRIYQVRTRP